jgi:pentatricopeptide repeat protein
LALILQTDTNLLKTLRAGEMSCPSRLIINAARQSQQTRNRIIASGIRDVSASRASSSSAASSTTLPERQPRFSTPPPQEARTRSARRGPKADVKRSSAVRDRREKEAITSLTLNLDASDVEGSWKSWLKVCESGQVSRISEKDITSLIEIIVKGKGDNSSKLITLSEVLLEDTRWESLSEVVKALFEAGQDEAILALGPRLLPCSKEERDTHRSAAKVLINDIIVSVAIGCSRSKDSSIIPLIQLVRPCFPTFIHKAGTKFVFKGDDYKRDGSGISLNGVVDRLKKYYPNAQAAQVPYSYCRHAMLAWGLDNRESFIEEGERMALRFRLLFEGSQFDSIQMLFETAMEARTDVFENWLSMTAKHDIKADWNDTTWYMLLSRSLSNRKFDLAAQVWTAFESIKPSNEVPTAQVWNALLAGYAQCAQWDSVQATWNRMKASGTLPDIYCYNSMIESMFQTWQSGEALLIFQEYREKVAKNELEWSISIVNSIIHGLNLNDRKEEANVLFQELANGKSGLPKPAISTVNVMLREHGRNEDYDKTMETMQTMSDLGLEPDKYTYSTLMDTFVRIGKKDAVDQVFTAMQAGGKKADSVSMTVLIKNFLLPREGNEEVDFVGALKILSRMERDGPRPGAVTYSNIIMALGKYSDQFEQLCVSGKVPDPYREYVYGNRSAPEENPYSCYSVNMRLALGLLDRMRQRVLRDVRPVFNSLMSALIGDFAPETIKSDRKMALAHLKKAMSLMEECKVDPGPTANTWCVVMEGLINYSQFQDLVVANEARKYMSETITEINKSEHHRTYPELEGLLEKANRLLSRL